MSYRTQRLLAALRVPFIAAIGFLSLVAGCSPSATVPAPAVAHTPADLVLQHGAVHARSDVRIDAAARMRGMWDG